MLNYKIYNAHKTVPVIIATLICVFVPSASQAAAIYFGPYGGIIQLSEHAKAEGYDMLEEKDVALAQYGYTSIGDGDDWYAPGIGIGFILGFEWRRFICSVDVFGMTSGVGDSYAGDPEEESTSVHTTIYSGSYEAKAELIVWGEAGLDFIVGAGISRNYLKYEDGMGTEHEVPDTRVEKGTDIDDRHETTNGYFVSATVRYMLDDKFMEGCGAFVEAVYAPDWHNEHPTLFAYKAGVFVRLDFSKPSVLLTNGM